MTFLEEKGILRTAIMGCLRKKPMTLDHLKRLVGVHETALTIAIRDLQNIGAIEHGYLAGDDWVDDWFGDEVDGVLPISAWRIK